ncbi:hypothetical protein L198_02319 [Cryptococcus wingfieldii CBS 7118]|uniref:Endoplasmic reticulum junction formation protein lunapark n=1 Tax=Cryptococcus wingfieldii CBS 7118 TaxID=1295528 RepID=A0A1E3JU70_9TREE|nr:hypothetical protein L198_02319 [Cryptococcus wingfieldii CBS 7118]ODO03472.1 hypothetical protein L198_02319 [Cryptococcus wingfieldii CBS 7118]
MGFFSFFSKSSPPDYETVLSKLASDVTEAKTNLSAIRLRERRTALLVNLYGVSFWAIWAGLWWVRSLPLGLIKTNYEELLGRIVGLAGIVGTPFLIWVLNFVVHAYFSRQRVHEETHLRKLLNQQRKQVDEIKKATNYDSTRKLIERYDEANGLGSPIGPKTPQRPGQVTPQHVTPSSKGPSGTPRAPGHLVGAGGTPGPAQPQTPLPVPQGLSLEQATAFHLQAGAIQPILPTPEKKWYDRVVDSILGDDPSQGNQHKYALVCEECFRHNGLVGSKYEWERMQWLCPRCNHLNPSPLSRLPPDPNQPLLATPTQPSKFQTQAQTQAPSTPSHAQRSSAASPRGRRQMGDKGSPKSSRLAQEVFNADDEEGDEGRSEEGMEVDEE